MLEIRAHAIAASGLAVVAMLATGSPGSAQDPTPVTVELACTGEAQTWVVPDGVTSILVEAAGAQGGEGWHEDLEGGTRVPGGLGGRSAATLSVTPGESLQVNVGCAGQDGWFATDDPDAFRELEDIALLTDQGGAGGFGGSPGGDGGIGGDRGSGGGGGGASDVRQGGTGLADRVLVAAGGGGTGGIGGYGEASAWSAGGNGGGATGADGLPGFFGEDPTPGGEGGTATAGGAGGDNAGVAGTAAAGGDGGEGNNYGAGGGGGGGLFGGGGGGGGSVGGGGGGGSSFAETADAVLSAGVQAGDGYVRITYTPAASAPTPPAARPVVTQPTFTG